MNFKTVLDSNTKEVDVSIDNNILTVENKEELLQNITEELSTWKGSWFNNIDYGVDWQNILGVRLSQSKVTYELLSIIKKYPDISKIDKLVFTEDTDRHIGLTVNFILSNDSKLVVEV